MSATLPLAWLTALTALVMWLYWWGTARGYSRQIEQLKVSHKGERKKQHDYSADLIRREERRAAEAIEKARDALRRVSVVEEREVEHETRYTALRRKVDAMQRPVCHCQPRDHHA